jgi:Abnormal spindle-like microcephaly-assoc'd, ASPM-SPD-2-Hydin/PQQ-like domain
MSARGSTPASRGSGRRLVIAATGVALALGVLPAITGIHTATAGADDVTLSQNPMRTGWDPNEPQLTPALVSTVLSPAPRFTTSVSGSVYAQPLVITSLNEIIVATENDQVDAITATGPNAGQLVWSKSLGSPFNIAGSSTFAKCTDLEPNIGVTGTPAYSDPGNGGNGDVYMFANILTSGKPKYYLVGIDPASGTVVQKTAISGHPSNDSHITFSAKYQMERPGVLWNSADGSIWGAFASHCDHKPYAGYVARVSTGSSPKVSLWTDEATLTNDQAGIWQGGGGLVEDPQGRIFVTSGNGVSPTRTNTPPAQLAESVIRLAYNSSTNHISAANFFSPANAPSLDAADTDFGSGGSVALPFGTSGTSSYPDILAAPSKDGRIWLLDRGALGGREQGPGKTDNDLSVIKSAGGDWGHPAAFADTSTLTPSNASTANDFLFYVGKDAQLQVFRFGVASSGKPNLSAVANSTLFYGYTSGSPVVTSTGTDPTTAVVWAVATQDNSAGKTGVGSQLTAYSLGQVASTGGTPSPCTSSAQCKLTPIWTSNTFTSSKFTTPATSGGWVYIGTRDGHLLGFAAPSTTAPALGSTAQLGQVAVGGSIGGYVSITASHPVTITGVSASTTGSNAPVPGSEFTAGPTYLNSGSNPVSFPVSLVKGDKLTTEVKFTPAAAGAASGTVSYTTSTGTFPSVDVGVVGEGTQAGLTPVASTIQFMGAPDQGVIPVAVGISIPQVANFTNFGTSPVTVTSVTPPSTPFSATGLPSVGTTIKPGESITVPVSYTPTMGVPSTGSLTIVTSGGSPATVQLAGTGVPAVSQFTAVNPVVNFGTIAVGKKATAYVRITNSGNTESSVQTVAPMATPFKATLTPPSQMPFNPGADLTVPVTFTPTKKGTFATQYVLSWTDVNGTHTIKVTLTGKAV